MFNTIQLEIVARLEHEEHLRAAAKARRLQSSPRPSRLWQWRTWWPAGKVKQRPSQPASVFERVETTPYHQPL